MKTLEEAIRYILSQFPSMSIPKEGYKIDDYISIFDFIKNDKKINIKNQAHIRKLLEDGSVLKRYWSVEMPEYLQYLALMVLGIEWLLYTSNFEDAQKGRMIFEKKIKEESNDQRR